MIPFITTYSVDEWKTVMILFSWLHEKPVDQDPHYFLRRVYQGSAGQGLIKNTIGRLMIDEQ